MIGEDVKITCRLLLLFGTWLSCMKLKFETKGFVKDIEIDGGAVMNSLIVTYMWVQMGFPTGVFGVRSQHLFDCKCGKNTNLYQAGRSER